MCELNEKHVGNQTTDVLYNGLPLAICSQCITAIMVHNDPTESLIDFQSSWVYKQANVDMV